MAMVQNEDNGAIIDKEVSIFNDITLKKIKLAPWKEYSDNLLSQNVFEKYAFDIGIMIGDTLKMYSLKNMGNDGIILKERRFTTPKYLIRTIKKLNIIVFSEHNFYIYDEGTTKCCKGDEMESVYETILTVSDILKKELLKDESNDI